MSFDFELGTYGIPRQSPMGRYEELDGGNGLQLGYCSLSGEVGYGDLVCVPLRCVESGAESAVE